MAAQRWLVTWCGGSKRVKGEIKQAVRLARSRSTSRDARDGCSGANVWREREPGPDKFRAGGEVVVVCRDKVCRKTGWLQSR